MQFQVLQPGDVIADRYRLVAQLGDTQRCMVFAAQDAEEGGKVALKVLKPGLCEIPEVAARFTREARIASELDSPHIVSALDMGAADGLMYYTMDLLEGHRLDKWLASRGPVPPALCVEIVHQLLEAMAESHNLGVIHRDLRPAKVWLTRGENTEHFVRVSDFGMAMRKENDPLVARISTIDKPIGSIAYQAPEQIIGGTVDERTDIYAIGHILFELLGGVRVYEDLDFGQIARLKIRGSGPTLRGAPLRSGLGPAVARATALDSSRRYGSCWEMLADLHQLRRNQNAATDELPAIVS